MADFAFVKPLVFPSFFAASSFKHFKGESHYLESVVQIDHGMLENEEHWIF